MIVFLACNIVLNTYQTPVLALGGITNYHRLGGFNKRPLFLMVPETEEFKVKVLANSLSGRGPFSCLADGSHFLCPFWQRDSEL